MSHLQKLSSLNRISLGFTRSHVKSSKMTLFPNGPYGIVQIFRVYSRKGSTQCDDFSNLDERDAPNVSRVVWKEAQAALLDYLHTTRGIQWLDAEHMSRHSPIFLGKLVKSLNDHNEYGRSVTRFLRYNPINEFEPLFESIGLKPSEYSPFLPRKLMFLDDDAVLLENFHVLCNYGIPRNSIGKIYKAAAEVFRYDHGVLQAKLQALRYLGLDQSAIVSIASSSPGLLVGDGNASLHEVIEMLKNIGIGSDWITRHLLEGYIYNWSHILELLRLLSSIVCNEELGKIIRHCPSILLDASGNTTFAIVGFFLKFGTTMSDISSVLLNLLEVQACQFLTNIWQCYKFLVDIGMEVEEIGIIVRSHPLLLGSCSLKKHSSLCVELKAGKNRICGVVKENPEILKEWVYGSQVRRLPKLEEDLSLKIAKSKCLPRKLMFLKDDAVLLENFHVLYDFGIPKNSIGKLYTEAAEVFRYDHGVLQEKLRALRYPGLDQSAIVRIVSSSPGLLIGDENKSLCEVVEIFKNIGIGSDWFKVHVLEGYIYNWSLILELLHLLSSFFCSEELGKIIRHCPSILLEASGNTTFAMVGFLLKFGTSKSDIGSMFLNLPKVKGRRFLSNIRQCYKFLVDLEMEVEAIGKIVRSRPVLLGSCTLKKLSSLRVELKASNNRIRDVVKENPELLKEWVFGSRVGRLPKLEDVLRKIRKTNFLLELGFAKDSNEMQKTLQRLQGNTWELQERFDVFVKAGFSRSDVIKMIEIAPHILNHSAKVTGMKINLVVNELGYPLSSLVKFPVFLSYTMQRIKLRVSMYAWLRDHGCVRPQSLGSIVNRTDDQFTRWYVSKHPKGPQIWEELKKQIYTD